MFKQSFKKSKYKLFYPVYNMFLLAVSKLGLSLNRKILEVLYPLISRTGDLKLK